MLVYVNKSSSMCMYLHTCIVRSKYSKYVSDFVSADKMHTFINVRLTSGTNPNISQINQKCITFIMGVFREIPESVALEHSKNTDRVGWHRRDGLTHVLKPSGQFQPQCFKSNVLYRFTIHTTKIKANNI